MVYDSHNLLKLNIFNLGFYMRCHFIYKPCITLETSEVMW